MHALPLLLTLLFATCAASKFTGIPELGKKQPFEKEDIQDEPGKPKASEDYPYRAKLHDNYDLYWRFNDTHIVFETIVKTTGYVALGVSGNGDMYPADVALGWVKDGNVVFSDRHTTAHKAPEVDAHQDWTLLAGYETSGFTVLKMVRELDTCDPQDLPILMGTTRVIFAFHEQDPENGVIQPHEVRHRGAKSILLLDPPADDTIKDAWPTDLISVDFMNDEYHVPSEDTTYHCMVWKMPDIGGKHHMIRYEPVIQKGHKELVHHILIYTCSDKIDEAKVGHQYTCYTEFFGHCENAIIGWAIGGNAFDYPKHVGFPFGTELDPKYIIMETHYDNLDLKADFVDSSGIRVFLTKELRPNDAGLLMTGVAVDEHQIVPPYEHSFISEGYCQEECLGELQDQDINVFGSLLHAHLVGVALRTRHFREGVELPPLTEDNTYDFNYQEQRLHREERTIKKGDSLITECEYNTMKRKGITYGGLTSRHEMCLTFLMYYPRVNLTTCLSRNLYHIPDHIPEKDIYKLSQSMDMSKETERTALKSVLQNYDLMTQCVGVGENPYYPANQQTSSIPNIHSVYTTPETCPRQ